MKYKFCCGNYFCISFGKQFMLQLCCHYILRLYLLYLQRWKTNLIILMKRDILPEICNVFFTNNLLFWWGIAFFKERNCDWLIFHTDHNRKFPVPSWGVRDGQIQLAPLSWRKRGRTKVTLKNLGFPLSYLAAFLRWRITGKMTE